MPQGCARPRGPGGAGAGRPPSRPARRPAGLRQVPAHAVVRRAAAGGPVGGAPGRPGAAVRDGGRPLQRRLRRHGARGAAARPGGRPRPGEHGSGSGRAPDAAGRPPAAAGPALRAAPLAPAHGRDAPRGHRLDGLRSGGRPGRDDRRRAGHPVRLLPTDDLAWPGSSPARPLQPGGLRGPHRVEWQRPAGRGIVDGRHPRMPADTDAHRADVFRRSTPCPRSDAGRRRHAATTPPTTDDGPSPRAPVRYVPPASAEPGGRARRRGAGRPRPSRAATRGGRHGRASRPFSAVRALTPRLRVQLDDPPAAASSMRRSSANRSGCEESAKTVRTPAPAEVRAVAGPAGT